MSLPERIEAYPLVEPGSMQISPDVQRERDRIRLGLLRAEHAEYAGDPAVQSSVQKEIDAVTSGKDLFGRKLSWNKSGNETLQERIEATPMKEPDRILATPVEDDGVKWAQKATNYFGPERGESFKKHVGQAWTDTFEKASELDSSTFAKGARNTVEALKGGAWAFASAPILFPLDWAGKAARIAQKWMNNEEITPADMREGTEIVAKINEYAKKAFAHDEQGVGFDVGQQAVGAAIPIGAFLESVRDTQGDNVAFALEGVLSWYGAKAGAKVLKGGLKSPLATPAATPPGGTSASQRAIQTGQAILTPEEPAPTPAPATPPGVSPYASRPTPPAGLDPNGPRAIPGIGVKTTPEALSNDPGALATLSNESQAMRVPGPAGLDPNAALTAERAGMAPVSQTLQAEPGVANLRATIVKTEAAAEAAKADRLFLENEKAWASNETSPALIALQTENMWTQRRQIMEQQALDYNRMMEQAQTGPLDTAMESAWAKALKDNPGWRPPNANPKPSVTPKYTPFSVMDDGVTKMYSISPDMLSTELKEALAHSAVRDNKGNLKIMFHGTTRGDYNVFNTKRTEFGAHFGSAKQANSFGNREAGRLIPVVLNIKNPLRMRDLGGWNAGVVANELYKMGIFSEADLQFVSDAHRSSLKNHNSLNEAELAETRAAHTLLKQKGYDGIVYLNRAEGIGNRQNMPLSPRTKARDQRRVKEMVDRNALWSEDSTFKYKNSMVSRPIITDEAFKIKNPQASDSYIAFDPNQIKGVFNRNPNMANVDFMHTIGDLLPEFFRKAFGKGIYTWKQGIQKMSDSQIDNLINEIDKIPFESNHPFDAVRQEIFNALVGERMRRSYVKEKATEEAFSKDDKNFSAKVGQRLQDPKGNVWEITLRFPDYDPRTVGDVQHPKKNTATYQLRPAGVEDEPMQFPKFVAEYELKGDSGWKVLSGPSNVVQMNSLRLPTAEEFGKVWELLVQGTQKPTADFIKDFKIPVGIDGHPQIPDLPARLGLSTASFRATNELIKSIGKPHQFAAAVAMHVDNMIKGGVEELHRMNIAFSDVWEKANKYYAMKAHQVLSRNKGMETFRDEIGIRLQAEKNPATWFDPESGRYFPTREQYVQMGMSEAASDVWVGIDRALQRMYEIEVEAAAMNGKPIPPQIPGYLPHTWKGPWRVKGYIMHPETAGGEPTGTFRKDPLFEFNAHNRKHRDAIYDSISKNMPEGQRIVMEKVDPSARNASTGDIIRGMHEARTMLEKQKGLDALMKIIYENAEKGIIASVLDRKALWKGGHMLERAAEYKKVGAESMTKEEMKVAMKSLQLATQAANEWYVRAKFVNETLFPLEKAGYLGAKNLYDTVEMRVNNFLGVQSTKAFETAVRQQFISAGMDPALGTAVGHALMSGVSKFYLWLKPAFYYANIGTALTAIPRIMLEANKAELFGKGKPSVAKALASWAADLPDIVRQNKTNPRVRNAIESGSSDPFFIEMADPSALQDLISVGIEKRQRSSSYVAGYHLYRQILPEAEALAAAGKVANQVAVPYQQMFGSPAVYGKLDATARPVTLFTTYPVHMFGMMNEALQLAKQALRQGKPALAAKIASSHATHHLTNLALFGAIGLPFMNNLDWLIEQLNKIRLHPIPTVREWNRIMDNALPEWARGIMQYGIPSKAMGWDLSTSGAGANIEMSTAYFSAINLLVQATLLGVQDLYKPVSRKQWWNDVGKNISGPAGGLVENLIKSETFSEVVERAKGNWPEKHPTSDIMLEGGIDRTKTESLMNMYFGVKSIDEKEARLSDRFQNMKEKHYQELWTNILQVVKEKGHIPPREMEMLLEIASHVGKEPGSALLEGLNNALKKQMTAFDERRIKDGVTAERALDQIRFIQQRLQEIGRGARQ